MLPLQVTHAKPGSALISCLNVIVPKASYPLSELTEMEYGSKPVDGGRLLLTSTERDSLPLTVSQFATFVRRFVGAEEVINGTLRYCLWIEDPNLMEAQSILEISERIAHVKKIRLESPKKATVKLAAHPHRFGEIRRPGIHHTIVAPVTFSETRQYFTADLIDRRTIASATAFCLYDAPLWNFAALSSRIFLIWLASVGGKLETRYRLTNTVVWNTFPIPPLTEKNRADLTGCAEDILLAREAHFPATIADLYDPDNMPHD